MRILLAIDLPQINPDHRGYEKLRPSPGLNFDSDPRFISVNPRPFCFNSARDANSMNRCYKQSQIVPANLGKEVRDASDRNGFVLWLSG